MSLLPATSCKEGVQQYCNYGYDKNLYSSYEDCMSKKMQECDSSGDSAQPLSDSELKEIGKQSECYGVSPLRVSCWSNGQKWTAIIGGTLVLYYILHKTGSLK